MLPQPCLDHISCLLHRCRKRAERKLALGLHSFMHQCGLEAHTTLGNYLVSMLAEVKSMRIAQQVFDRLMHGNEQSWNSLITGYLKCGLPRDALYVYQRMRMDYLIRPGKHTFVALLKACVNLKDFEACTGMHAEIARLGFLDRDLLVGNTLVSVYTDCGLLARAQEVADKLPMRDVATWNVLMAAYAKLELYVEVLHCLEKMEFEGISPDSITYTRCLKACGNLEDKEKGEELHTVIERKGFLGGDHVVGSSLVDMYCKCGLLTKALDVFDKLAVKDVVSWTTLIRGYADHGLGEEALQFFERMQAEGIFPDAFTLSCSLKACVSLGAADRGQEIHLEIEKKGLLEGDQVIGNMLVDLYAKCNLLADAQKMFERLPVRDAISCNALIAGYAEHGYDEEALKCFERMPERGVSPDAVTHMCLLKACGRTGALDKGRDIHCEVERIGLLQKDIAIGNTVIDMYARCGCLVRAHEVFDKLPVRDIVTWTVLLAGYAEHGHRKEAMKCLEEMQLLGFSPDAVSLICSLQACSKMSELDAGRELHNEIERKGFLERELVVGNNLVNMYSKCGSLVKAQEVFDKLPIRDVVSWNALISGYAEHGHGEEAFICLEQMRREGVFLDTTTSVCLLKACCSTGASHKGRDIHEEIGRKGLLGKDLIASNAVLDMYAKCGSLAKVQQVFEELPVRDVVSWTILIATYADHGYGEHALKIFEQMQRQGVSPDAVALVCGLNACSITGATQKGGELQVEIERETFLKENCYLGSSLVHLYANCGWLAKAQQVFDKLLVRDIVCWNALMAGYARFGGVEHIVSVLDKMLGDDVKPNFVTCIIVLTACRRLGLFYKNQTSFEVTSTIDSPLNFSRVINFLWYVDKVNKAVPMFKEMTPSPNVGVLRACRMGGNLEYAKWAFEHVAWENRYADAYAHHGVNGH